MNKEFDTPNAPTSPTKELLDIVDLNGNPTGRTHVRGTKIDAENGDYFRAVTVCMINSQGKMLIQQRQTNKRSWPGMWDISASGAISQGETPQVSGMREVHEELGVSIDLSKKRPTLVTTFRDGFTYTFVEKLDLNPEELTIQEEELLAVKLASREEIRAMTEAGVFIPYRSSWLDYVFDVAEQEFIF